MNKEQNQTEEKGDIKLRRKIKILYVVTSILFVGLVIMSSFFYIQLMFVKEVVDIAIDALKAELIREAPEEVDREEIDKTLERVREAIPKAFLAVFTGDIDFDKVQATVNYAQKARDDEQWTAKEVNTLLHLMNASMKFDKEE